MLHEKNAVRDDLLDEVFASSDLSVAVPKYKMPEQEQDPRHAYQIVVDELMLDGNSRQNLATFCQTWLEPEVNRIMDLAIDKNMIDKDEYPQTAELEERCVHMLAGLWNSPDAANTLGTSTTGSSEAAMLGGMALLWNWRARRKAEGKSFDKPNLVCGPVQICWHKFVRYWDVEIREIPLEGDRLIMNAAEAVKRCDDNTIGAAETSQTPVVEKAAATAEPSTSVCLTEPRAKSQLIAMGDKKETELLLAQAGRGRSTNGKKPNILFITGDDIGWMQPRCYHRGLMVGETPNIDRIAREGAIFMDYVAMQSCTSGRNAFITGMYPLRTGMIPPQLPGSPSYLQPGTPCIAKFLLDLGYTTGQFGKNHLGDHPDGLPTAHGFQEYWGYLYHLDAMQQVSFPDINSSPLVQGIAPPMKVASIPGIPDPPGAIDPKDGVCMAVPRPILLMKSPDGTAKNQMGKDEGPLTLERSKTVEEEVSNHVIDWLDRNDPKKTGKPFFCYYNNARMHVTTMLPPKYLDMLGVKGGKDWGIQEAGMKQMDDCIGTVLQKLDDMGEADNTIVVFTTDNGAEAVSFPDGGVTPFRGQKGQTWECGYRAPCVVRWPGHIKPGTVKDQLFAALDWLPTLVEIAGGPKGNELKAKIEKGAYPGIVKTTLDGVNQLDYLTGKSEKSARDYFFYYAGATPSAVRYKNWKFYYSMAAGGATGWFAPLVTYHWTMIQNIKRDPFEQAVGLDGQKTAFGFGGALAAPSTAYIYDWNILPIGQLLWEKELMSYKEFPPLQAPETYNLTGILDEMKKGAHPSD